MSLRSHSTLVAVALVVLAGVWAVVSGGCATVHPPMAGSHEEPDAELTPVRADADGLHLSLKLLRPDRYDEIEIWRRVDEADWQAIETISVDEQLAEALQEGRAEWVDTLDDRRVQLDYRLRLVGEDNIRDTEVRTIDYHGWLDPPSPRVRWENSESKVVVQWDHDAGLEGRLLRRDVLDQEEFSPVAIVDAAAGNRFYDTDIEPGGVYTYRIQLVDRRGDVPRFSPFAETSYVTVPED